MKRRSLHETGHSDLPASHKERRSRWRTMEAAPRDGSTILCLNRFGEYEITRWDTVIGCWVSKHGAFAEPVRWLRLPKPPPNFQP